MSAHFTTRLAKDEHDLILAQELRYEVFVKELGAYGAGVDHHLGREADEFDPYFDHLMLFDEKSDRLVGVYRLLRDDQMPKIGYYYSQNEYDLSVLIQSERKLLELGRSCIHAEYRGGTALYHLWAALADYVKEHRIEILFGVASFHGTDIEALGPSLSLLHHRYRAEAAICPRAVKAQYQSMNLMAYDDINRVAAMAAVPSLIKGYLKLGGKIGDGAYIDHSFNTTDICLVIDTEQVNLAQAQIYTKRLLS